MLWNRGGKTEGWGQKEEQIKVVKFILYQFLQQKKSPLKYSVNFFLYSQKIKYSLNIKIYTQTLITYHNCLYTGRVDARLDDLEIIL